MGDEVPGVTMCPECDSELLPTGSDDGRPLQCVEQACTNDSCDWTTTLSLVWYPNGVYDIVAGVHDDIKCADCPASANQVVVESDIRIPVYFCAKCIKAHHATAIDRCRKE